MEVSRFELFNPLDYRYIPRDPEMLEKLKDYNKMDKYSKLNRVVSELIIPRLNSLEVTLLGIATSNQSIIVPKRIDGEYVVEGDKIIGVNVADIFITYVERIRYRTQNIKSIPFNFQSFEESKRNDRLSDLVYFLISTLSVEANIANNIRHLFRSEIGELDFEEYYLERVGSSTMPHKRNPVEFENVVSFWKAYLPRVTSAIISQITEHQEDSTTEHLTLYTFELCCAISYVTKYLENSLKNIKLNKTLQDY